MLNSRRTPILARILLICFLAPPAFAGRQETPDQRYAQAGLWVDEGRYDRAIATYQSLLSEAGPETESRLSRIYNNLGFCFYKLDRPDEARAWYEKALAVDGRYAVCLNNLAALLMNQRKFGEALPFLERAFALDARNVKVIFNLFVVQANLENEEEAKRFLRLALDVDRSYTMRRLKSKNISDASIARILRRLGESDSAPGALKR